jgi:hypothetical protein
MVDGLAVSSYGGRYVTAAILEAHQPHSITVQWPESAILRIGSMLRGCNAYVTYASEVGVGRMLTAMRSVPAPFPTAPPLAAAAHRELLH